MDLLDVLSVLITIHSYTQEYLMLTSDAAALAALLLFSGGVVFWFMILFMVVTGVCRGIRHLYYLVFDLIAARRFKPAE